MAVNRIDREVGKLFEEARRNTGPRKHHLVPSSYLARWAGPTGRVRVRDLDAEKEYSSTPSNAARRTDYYRAESDDLNPSEVPPMLFETMLSRVEGPASAAIDELIQLSETITARARYDMASFMAFQFVRGERPRAALAAQAQEIAKLQSLTMTEERITEMLQEAGEETTDDAIRFGLEAFEALRNDEIIMRPQEAQLIWLSFADAQQLTDVLFRRAWIVASTHPSLITTDEPVLPIAGPGWWGRTESCGMVPAGIVATPLAPDRILLAVRRDLALLLGLPLSPDRVAIDELDLVETFEICHELVMSATRWAFEHPERRVLTHLPVPPMPDPVSVSTYASVDGDSELVRMFSHTRLRNAGPWFDWPLGRFWAKDWRCWPMPDALIAEAEAAVPDALRALAEGAA